MGNVAFDVDKAKGTVTMRLVEPGLGGAPPSSVILGLDGQSSASAGSRAIGKGGIWFNVLDYGAVGDGQADDTLAIQAALDAVPAVGATVYFPWGTYKVSAALRVHPNTHLLGFSDHLYDVDTAMSPRIISTGAIYAIFDGSGSDGVWYDGLGIDGNQNTGGTTALILQNKGAGIGEGFRITDCRITRGAGHGVQTDYGPVVFACNIGYNAGRGLYVSGAANDVSIANTYIEGNGILGGTNGDGIYTAYAGNLYILNVHSEFNHGAGLNLRGTKIRIICGLYDRNDLPGILLSGVWDSGIYDAVITRNGVAAGATADNNTNVYVDNFSNSITIADCVLGCGQNDIQQGPYTPYNGVTVLNSRNVKLRNLMPSLNPADNTALMGTFRSFNLQGNTDTLFDGAGVDMFSTDPTAGLATLISDLTVASLPTPSAPSVAPTGGAAGTYTYRIVAVNGAGDTVQSTATTINNGPTALDATHFNDVGWGRVSGATGYKVIRTAGGPSQGVLQDPRGQQTGSGAITIPANSPNPTFRDTGIAAAAYTPAGSNPGGALVVQKWIVGRVSDGHLPLSAQGSGGQTKFYTNTFSTQVAAILSTGAIQALRQLYPGDEAASLQSSGGLLHSTGVPSNANGNNNDYCISDNGNLYFRSGGVWGVVSGAGSQATPGAPAGTTSTTGVMMGLAGSITPKTTGRVLILISGDILNATAIGDGGSVQIRHGTGAAPTNGAALTGTADGGKPQYSAATTGEKAPFSLNAIVTGLALGTPVWIDAAVAALVAGTAQIENVSISAIEL